MPIQPALFVFSNFPRRVRETRPGAVETWEQVGLEGMLYGFV